MFGRLRYAVVVACFGLVTGCGQRVAQSGLDVSSSDGAPLATCQQAIAGLESELYAESGQACSVVLRLDQAYVLLGYQVFCGPYVATDEQAARAAVLRDTGHTAGKMLNTVDAQDVYVFYQAPLDFGGAAVVSKRSGLTLIGAVFGWQQGGGISYPRTWRAASELGSDCPPVGTGAPLVGYTLGGSAVSASDLKAVFEVVERTAVPAAFMTEGYLFDVVALTYNTSPVAGHKPEWIVIVNGGWLE